MVEKIIDTGKTIWARAPISWGAVFAGWLFAYAFALLLYLLGAAVGVTSLAALNTLSTGIAVGTGVWMVAAWVIATFVGSVIAGRLAGFPERGSGAMHGLVVWALSGIMTLLMATAQAAGAAAVGTSATRNVAKIGQQIPQGIQQSFSQEIKERATQAIDQMPGAEEISREEARQSIDSLDQPAVIEITAYLLEGNTDQAREVFSQQTALSDQEIDSVVNGLSQRVQYYQDQAADTAGRVVEQARDYTSASLWFLFISSLLGLCAGAWGGSLGAGMAAKDYLGTKVSYPSEVPYSTEEEKRKVV